MRNKAFVTYYPARKDELVDCKPWLLLNLKFCISNNDHIDGWRNKMLQQNMKTILQREEKGGGEQ